MSNSTVYDVSLVYGLKDQASSGLAGIAGGADRAAKSTDLLSTSLGALGALAAGAFGFDHAKKALFDFNSELQTMKIQASTVIFGNDLADSFEAGQQAASNMMAEFQKFSLTSPVTTKQIFDFSNGISTAVAQAGGSLKDITTYAERGVIAAKALGANSDYAALELTEGIQKGVTARQRFLKQVLGMSHVEEATFNGQTPEQRMVTLQSALSSPALKQAAIAYGQSWEGVKSTFEDITQLAEGQAGAPLFKAIIDEVKTWNDWLLKNKKQVDDIATAVGSGLVEGFRDVKAAVGFIVDHAGEIKLLVEGLLLLKGVGLAANGLSGLGSIFKNASQTMDILGNSSARAAAGFDAVLGSVTQTATALAGLYLAANAFADWVNANHDSSVAKQQTLDSTNAAIKSALGGSKSAQMEVLGIARGAGAVDDFGALDSGKMADYFRGKGGEDSPQVLLQEVDMIARVLKRIDPDDLLADDRRTIPKMPDAVAKKPPTVNISISRVEVRSDDPDRFAMGLVEIGRKSLARPTQAMTSPRI